VVGGALDDVSGLATWLDLAGQCALVDLQRHSLCNAHIGRDAVARGERHDVARHELVGEDRRSRAIAHQVTEVGHELVERLEALF
jgi:hypothetical protein